MVERHRGQAQEEDLAAKVAWRVVGATESPLLSPRLTDLINSVVSKYVPCKEQKGTIETINGWYETRDGLPALADRAKEEVDELVLRGAAQLFLKTEPVPHQDALFWAVGAVDTETAAKPSRLHGVRNKSTRYWSTP